MTGMLDSLGETDALCSIHTGSSRKYAHTLEALRPPGSTWVGVHSALANKMVLAALEAGVLEQHVGPFTHLQREVKYGKGGKSRVDFVLTRPCKPGQRQVLAYLEVKSATLAEPHLADPNINIALFPDTVSERAQRHLADLASIVEAGNEALCVFLIQRGDCTRFAPDWRRDPAYAKLLGQAAAAGVQCVALRCDLQTDPLGGAVVEYVGTADVELDYRKPPGGKATAGKLDCKPSNGREVSKKCDTEKHSQQRHNNCTRTSAAAPVRKNAGSTGKRLRIT